MYASEGQDHHALDEAVDALNQAVSLPQFRCPARCSTVGREFGRSPVRVHVDRERCQGHNRCYALAPELFEVDEEGNAHELNDGAVPTDLEEKARLAAANCP